MVKKNKFNPMIFIFVALVAGFALGFYANETNMTGQVTKTGESFVGKANQVRANSCYADEVCEANFIKVPNMEVTNELEIDNQIKLNGMTTSEGIIKQVGNFLIISSGREDKNELKIKESETIFTERITAPSISTESLELKNLGGGDGNILCIGPDGRIKRGNSTEPYC